MNSLPALSVLWTDKMTVTEYQSVEQPNGATGFEEVVVLADVPCKLSFSTLANVDREDENAPTRQTTKVFCDVTHDIKAGVKISVTRAGRETHYRQSGVPGKFSAHQEIVLVPFEGWA